MSRALAAALVLVCSCGSAPAPPPVEVASAPVVVLPLSFREGLPEIDVAVGDEHVTLMIDTGSGAAFSIHPSVLGRLGGAVSYTGRQRRYENARGSLLVSREVVLDRLRLGPLEWSHVTGQELAFAEDFAPPNRDGYVGRGLFVGHRLLVDYGASRLTVLSGEPQQPEEPVRGAPATPVTIDSDGIVVAVTLDGSPARFVVDTGSTHSLLRPRGAPGGVTRHDLVVCGQRLPGFELVESDAGPPGVDGLLGRSFFEGRRILLDLPGRRMWVL